MEYNDHDIGGFDDFTLNQIFLNKTKEEYDIFLTLISTLKKFEGQRVLMTFIQGESDIILYKILSIKFFVPFLCKMFIKISYILFRRENSIYANSESISNSLEIIIDINNCTSKIFTFP